MPARRTAPVRLIMAVPAVSIAPTATLRRVTRLLEEEGIGAVVVLAQNELQGLLSERDVVRALADGADPDLTRVDAAMTAHPLWVDEETPIEVVGDLMLETDVRHVPVMAGRDVIGMVSIRDVLDATRQGPERAG
jgi:CBS domain-containing protein